ncbi:efflux transporter outer membrane subunit [Solimicrobium silvestre]|uniref:efflux transporter outer membrane subunit n=1 Tax=Solimicrobium silvestre TaxID=2099400 RepID=UPI0013FD4947|nr:efflux transporter outer membrane subunit [Solimicrobium silvestre]
MKFALLLGAVILAGCSVGPEYKRPDIAAPSAWHENASSSSPPISNTTAPETAHWPSTEWWHGFACAELDAYIAQAKLTNNDLAAAVARVRQADQLANIAGAALLPTLGASFTALNEREQATTGNYVAVKQFSPQLNASYMLDFWGKNRAAQDAAIATAAASRHDQVTVELTVISSVAQSYFQSLALRERVAVAEHNLANAEITLKGLQQQLHAGVATALDVAQQETTVATLAAALPPLRLQLRQTLNALAILVGKTPETVEVSNQTLADLTVPEVRPGLPSELLERRPDVAEAEDQLIAANANIGVARAAFFPSIELTASYGYASSALAGMTNSANIIHTLAAGITQPIFDGGAIKGQYEFSKARYDELLANYRKAILSALGNVEDALVAVQQNTEQVKRLEFAVQKAARAHHIAQAQLHAGTVNILAVLNTETALFTAQDALIQAKNSHLEAYLSLFGALGGGWQKEAGK